MMYPEHLLLSSDRATHSKAGRLSGWHEIFSLALSESPWWKRRAPRSPAISANAAKRL